MDPIQADESFREVIEFVKCLYIELSQSKSHFNDYSCIFCSSAYFELIDLISHIEDFHRDQILQGTFDLEHNFEEFLRSRILGSGASKEEGHSSSPYEMYQCAKCQQTFVSVSDITEHLVICSREEVVAHQTVQPQPVIDPPIVNQNLYGCARCGYRFGMLRDLVVHLHTCTVDTFYNKNQYLMPHLYVEAPNNQHIVVNEAETNTTLNTPSLWLMSNITGPCTEDSVMKGFWVMPPPNNHHLPLTTLGIQAPVAATQSVAAATPSESAQTVLVVQPPDTSAALQMSKPKSDSSLYTMQAYVINEIPNNNAVTASSSSANTTIVKPVVIPIVEKPKRKRGTEIKTNGEVTGKRKRQTQQQQQFVTVAATAPSTSVISVPHAQQSYQPAPQPPQPQPPQPQLVQPQVHTQQQGPFENYVITYEDNTTQIISPGDELYEHVVNSYKEQRLTESGNVVELADIVTPQPIITSPPSQMTPVQTPIDTTHMTTAKKDLLASYPIDDLSHLDKPIHLPSKISLTSPKDHYLASYCSFLETRQKNKV